MELKFKKLGNEFILDMSHQLGRGAFGTVYKGYFY
jgi:hypothetical protein